ncbi:hypothetical protein EI94DRAFT_1708993 [Lactarius quietus]|nr:hypothetical protein EI94DRAFT_1708993 [Lactarius quietus]
MRAGVEVCGAWEGGCKGLSCKTKCHHRGKGEEQELQVPSQPAATPSGSGACKIPSSKAWKRLKWGDHLPLVNGNNLPILMSDDIPHGGWDMLLAESCRKAKGQLVDNKRGEQRDEGKGGEEWACSHKKRFEMLSCSGTGTIQLDWELERLNKLMEV